MGATDPNFADKTLWTGDNLPILRGMNAECVDLIYLDPPFNSNQNYAAPVGSKAAGAAFKDTWSLSDLDVAWMGLIADEKPAVAHTLKAAGFSHWKGMQSYLTMMAVRLLEMHRVLKDTGSIYLHCDPTASHYLKQLMDAVFGQGNFRNEVVWNYSFRLMDLPRFFNRKHDLILFYAKTQSSKFSMPKTPWTREEIIKTRKQKIHFDEQGNELIWMPGGRGNSKSRLKTLSDIMNEGKAVSDVWNMPVISSSAKERIGYPTQKPLALLERIISASSNTGDVVLDPFCGCATACVAADQLDRKWVGIDISPKAVELVNLRLQQAMGGLFHHGYVTARTDIEKPKPYHQNKHVLFGQQEGLCNGCKGDFPFKLYEVDHVVPKSKGGTDHLGNLQLLCGHCNKIKSDKPQEHLIAQLRELAYV